jgi:hypothetical protein
MWFRSTGKVSCSIAPGPSTIHPRGRVEGQTLRLEYEIIDHAAAAVRQRFEQDMRVLEQTLRTTHALIDQYNGEIKALIPAELRPAEEEVAG